MLTTCIDKFIIIGELNVNTLEEKKAMKKNNETAILAPANGKVIALSKTSDPIFSKGTMG